MLHSVNQLTLSRQAIAQHLAKLNHPDLAAGSATPTGTGLGIPPAFTDLALMAIAEKLLRQFTPARTPFREVPVLQTAHVLLHATAQSHPGGLVLAAALVGAGVAATRPWRWLRCSDVLPQLLTQLASQALTRRHNDKP
jgi:hypothetical protein